MPITIPTLTPGETVARAKRTERAEARRRYRAANAPDATTDVTDGAAPAASAGRTASTTAPSAKSSASSTPSGRIGFAAAFKLSIRPLHVREDLAALPWIAIHTKALWVPLLITIASTVATAITGSGNLLTEFLFTYFVVFPAIGGVFIAGFLAPRASWLLGIIVGFVSAVCYVAMGSGGYLPSPFAEVFAANPLTSSVTALLVSPIVGAFFAAAAAWYRRFLALSSPNRGRSQAGSQKKQGDGRSRGGSTSQKANAKR